MPLVCIASVLAVPISGAASVCAARSNAPAPRSPNAVPNALTARERGSSARSAASFKCRVQVANQRWKSRTDIGVLALSLSIEELGYSSGEPISGDHLTSRFVHADRQQREADSVQRSVLIEVAGHRERAAGDLSRSDLESVGQRDYQRSPVECTLTGLQARQVRRRATIP